MSNIDNPDASLGRRLIAMVYDSLLVLATLIVVVLLPASFLITFAVITPGTASYSLLMLLASLLAVLVFYGWFWTHGGQTLGMRTWRLRLVTTAGEGVGWRKALLRFVIGLPAWLLIIIGVEIRHSAAAGLSPALFIFAGIVWLLLENRPGNWRDRWSQTRIVVLPKPQR